MELTLAGVGSRFASALVDNLIQTLVIVALAVVFLGARALTGAGVGGYGAAVFTLLGFLVYIAYDISFEVLANGRTPGKRMNGLRVVREGGQPVNFLASAVRNTLRVVDYLPGGYLVGMISILVSRKNQRLGDLAAGTVVVRERKPPPPAPPSTRPATEAVAWDVSSVSPDEVAAVRAFLARRHDVDSDARREIAHTLAARLRPKVRGAPADLPVERFLETLAALKSSRE